MADEAARSPVDEAARSPVDGHRLSLVRTALDPGATVVPSPPLDGERALYFLAGEGEADIDGRPHRVEEGDTLRLPPGVRFGVRNTQAHRTLVFVTAAPPALRPPPVEGPLAPLANRLAWALRRVAKRLAR